MSGGGMGLWVDPSRHARFRDEALEIMIRTKRELEDALPGFRIRHVHHAAEDAAIGGGAEQRRAQNAIEMLIGP